MPTTYKIVEIGGVKGVIPAPEVVITPENAHEYISAPTREEGFLIDWFDEPKGNYPTLYKKGSKNRFMITDNYGRSAYITKNYLDDEYVDEDFRLWLEENFPVD